MRTCSGPLSNIFRVRGNWWECGVYWVPTAPVAPGRLGGRSRLTGCLATSLVRLELLALDVGGEPLAWGGSVRFTRSPASAAELRPAGPGPSARPSSGPNPAT